MSILIGALEFDGPCDDIDLLSDTSGIYAVLSENNGEFELVDMGESEYVRESLQEHADRQQWQDEGLIITFAVHYTSDLSAQERREIKEALDREFSDPVAA